jgi:hypothetical protein
VELTAATLARVVALGCAACAGFACSDGTLDTAQAIDDLLIDDFEDGDMSSLAQGGRGDFLWYCYNDSGTSAMVEGCLLDDQRVEFPAVPDRGKALHMSGGPFPTWGAGVGVPLAPAAESYDLSRFVAVAFSARVADGSVELRVNLPSSVRCNVGETCPQWGKSFVLGQDWATWQVPLDSEQLDQDGVGPRNDFDAQRVTDIQFLFRAGVTFDFWLDDVELVLGSP